MKKGQRDTLDALENDAVQSGGMYLLSTTTTTAKHKHTQTGFTGADCLFYETAYKFHLADQKVKALQRA